MFFLDSIAAATATGLNVLSPGCPPSKQVSNAGVIGHTKIVTA
jgi:hypothetical protein